jgi:hypothetical protein
MPTFNNVPVETSIEVDFEVYCNTCGAGLCNESETGTTRNRHMLHVSVNACPTCMAAKDDEIDALRSRIDELQAEIDNLKEQQ